MQDCITCFRPSSTLPPELLLHLHLRGESFCIFCSTAPPSWAHRSHRVQRQCSQCKCHPTSVQLVFSPLAISTSMEVASELRATIPKWSRCWSYLPTFSEIASCGRKRERGSESGEGHSSQNGKWETFFSERSRILTDCAHCIARHRQKEQRTRLRIVSWLRQTFTDNIQPVFRLLSRALKTHWIPPDVGYVLSVLDVRPILRHDRMATFRIV